jgi:hypothetical protein
MRSSRALHRRAFGITCVHSENGRFVVRIEAPTEAKIAARDLVMNVDLYKSDHHGSDTSSIADFMNDLRPSVIVISNGNNVIYHHPRQVTLTTYAAWQPPPTVFQTNKCLLGPPCGNVPDAQIADPETVDEDGTIQITVDAPTNSYTVRYGATVRTFQVKAPATAPVTTATTAGVIIESLLPNPVGDDVQSEEVTLRNKGTSAVSVVGWTLQDRSGGTWTLTGSLAAGQSQTFKRNGQAMSLNNTGDEIVLLDAVPCGARPFQLFGVDGRHRHQDAALRVPYQDSRPLARVAERVG